LNLAQQARLKLAREMDRSSRDDGRAKSSAFQLTEADKENVKTVIGETTTTTDTEDLGDGVTKKTDTSTTPTTVTTTKEKEGTDAFKKACYVNGVFQEGKVINGIKCVKSKDPDWKDTTEEVEESEDVTKKVSCECKKPDGGIVVYTAPDGACLENKPEACMKQPETTETPDPTPPTCYCVSAVTGQKVFQGCPKRITDKFNAGKSISMTQSNTSKTAGRKHGWQHGPNEISLYRM
jgi:hypothetical protein